MNTSPPVRGNRPATLRLLSGPAVMGSLALQFFAGNPHQSDVETSQSSVVATSPQSQFLPMTPCRVIDTRYAGAPYITGGAAARTIGIRQTCGLPPTALAYSLNVTVVPRTTTATQSLTIWPAGQSQPLNVTSVVAPNGAVRGVATIVAAGTNGDINVVATSDTELIIDVSGSFVPLREVRMIGLLIWIAIWIAILCLVVYLVTTLIPMPANIRQIIWTVADLLVLLQILQVIGLFIDTPGALQFYPLTPCRIADTRGGFFGSNGPPAIATNETRTMTMSGACNVPPSAVAYSLNVTALRASAPGNITAFPAGQEVPIASTVNYGGHPDIVGNAAIVWAGTGTNNAGKVSFYANASGADLIVDINGYFATPGPGGLNFYPMAAPCRVANTALSTNGVLGGPAMPDQQTRWFPLASGTCNLPRIGATYALTFTVSPDGPFGNLTTWAAGQPMPYVTTLNAPSGLPVANGALVSSSEGSINVKVNSQNASIYTNVAIDASGFFAPATITPSAICVLAKFRACVL